MRLPQRPPVVARAGAFRPAYRAVREHEFCGYGKVPNMSVE
ncbi:hypothetical protein OKW28_002985 [Paraburkholderia sp. 40]